MPIFGGQWFFMTLFTLDFLIILSDLEVVIFISNKRVAPQIMMVKHQDPGMKWILKASLLCMEGVHVLWENDS